LPSNRRVAGDHHRVGPPGSASRRRHRARGLSPIADQIADHDQLDGDPDPQQQRSRHRKLADGIHQRQASSDRLFRVVLVRVGIAEVDEHAIAQYFATNPSRRLTVSAMQA
jgi:hypothetical protein